jgi:hypothetical protein
MTNDTGRMSDAATAPVTDDRRIVDDALAVLDDARARAPRDFLFALGVALALGGLAFLAFGLVGSGVTQDLALNVGVQLLGTWLTVVVIDGLWKRQEAGASESLDAMRRQLELRGETGLSPHDREAWTAIVSDYRGLVRSESLPRRLGSLRTYRGRIRELEAKGWRALAIAGAPSASVDNRAADLTPGATC